MQTAGNQDTTWPAYWRLFVPKLVIALREGYGLERLGHDALAGLTVAILALPLSMAIAIGCGVTPDKGLITSVVAGLCISVLGGSRFQIGGPAAAFIVVVANVIEKHGYGGLMVATLLAGLILIVAGLMRLGTFIKYIPGPVIVGFTSGLGILIGLGQIKDFIGMTRAVAPDVVHKVADLVGNIGEINPWALAVGAATLAAITGSRRLGPRFPGLLIAVVGMSLVSALAGLPVETIGTRFGGIPSSLPMPQLPDFQLDKLGELLPTVFTIAFLVGVESLLSAVAADTMAGSRHRSNIEIVAQGVANVVSPLFGGLPATGVIARTGTNIAAGAQTPVAGVLHSVFVLLFMLLAAPLAAYLALPCLAAVLLATAWRLLDLGEVMRFLTRAPSDDRAILIVTLLLTVFSDLSVAIAVGVVLASMLFMHRMSELPGLELAADKLIIEDEDDFTRPPAIVKPEDIPAGIAVFQFRGPLFFGAARNVETAVANLKSYPRVMILRLREVPLIDATAASALGELGAACDRHSCRIIITGLQSQPRAALHRLGFLKGHRVLLASNIFMAVEKAKELLESASR